MGHLLPTGWTAIEYQSVAVSEQFGCGQQFGDKKQVSNQVAILLLNIVIAGNRFPRDDQDVRRRLGINISNRKTQLVLMNKVSRDLAVGNSLKECFLRHRC